MRYERGDYVYPLDLSRAVLCRVTRADNVSVPGHAGQLLRLEPADHEWSDTRPLVRRDDGVAPAYPRQLDCPWADRIPLRPPNDARSA